MPSPLVRTKLYVPQVRRGLVPRPRLADRLGRQARSPRLTLVSAPPGFGKTTLLAAWAEAATAAGRPVAWVSLEESEQRARLVLDLRRHRPGHRGARASGAGALPLLQAAAPADASRSSPPCSTSSSALPTGLDLVLDDYHLADGPAIAARRGVPARAPAARTCTW